MAPVSPTLSPHPLSSHHSRGSGPRTLCPPSHPRQPLPSKLHAPSDTGALHSIHLPAPSPHPERLTTLAYKPLLSVPLPSHLSPRTQVLGPAAGVKGRGVGPALGNLCETCRRVTQLEEASSLVPAGVPPAEGSHSPGGERCPDFMYIPHL